MTRVLCLRRNVLTLPSFVDAYVPFGYCYEFHVVFVDACALYPVGYFQSEFLLIMSTLRCSDGCIALYTG